MHLGDVREEASRGQHELDEDHAIDLDARHPLIWPVQRRIGRAQQAGCGIRCVAGAWKRLGITCDRANRQQRWIYMLVPEDGNSADSSADSSADFVRACGQRSATGSVTLSCRDGSPEPSPASPGCYLSIYLSIYLSMGLMLLTR